MTIDEDFEVELSLILKQIKEGFTSGKGESDGRGYSFEVIDLHD